MHARALSILALYALGSGCGPSTVAETQWVRWFSDVSLTDAADTPQGDTVVVGRSVANEWVGELPLDSGDLARPFIARVDADGEVLHEWRGLLGWAPSVATDDRGRAYVMLDDLRDTVDFSEPSRCEIQALDTGGELRWAMDWGCAGDLEVVDGVLVATTPGRLEGYDLDGNQLWKADTGLTSLNRIAADESSVWWARNDSAPMSDRVLAWRADVHSGEVSEIELGVPGGVVGSIRALDGGVAALIVSPFDPAQPTEIELVSFASDGRVRWRQRVGHGDPYPDEPDTWLWALVTLTDQGAPWVVGSEWWYGGDDAPEVSHRRIVAQRWDTDGTREEALRYGFVTTEPGTPVDGAQDIDRIGCPNSEAAIRGSWTYKGLSRDDGLLVVGRQDCRDSFLLKVEAPW